MANTTIKITQLQNIGNGLATNTLLPVVNTSGTAITQKVTVGNVANFIMGQAGNTLAPAFLANLSYSVVNAAQPNITSVGTLSINTLKISGGTNGYVLQTDGTGNLSWTAQTGGGGNGTPGGSNAQIQYNLNGEFAGDPDLIWDAGTSRLLTSAIEPGAIYTDEYYYANGEPFTSSANTGNIGFTGNAIYNLGGVIVENADLTHGATAALTIPINGNTTSPVQITNTYGDIQVTTGINSGSLKYWTFDQYGTLNFPGGTVVQDDIEGTGNFGFETPANIGFGILTDAGNYAWSFGSDGNLTLPNDGNIAIYGNTTQFNTCPNGFLGLNSYDAGSNNIARVNISSIDEIVSIGLSNPITEIDYNWTFATGGGTIFPTLSTQRGDNPSGTITGQTLLFGDATQEAVISTPDGNNTDGINSQRLVINPGQGYGSGEGGDIYLWAGRGGNGSGSGGDIKIRGGQGGGNSGAGGYIRMEAGDAASTGVAGYIDVTGGAGGTGQGGGYVHITGGNGDTLGGEVKIYGGYGQATGGNVNIWGGGTANGQINEGLVNIQTGGYTWTYDSRGSLTLPSGTGPGSTTGYIQTANDYPTLLAYGSGSHGGPELDWMDSDDPANTFNDGNVLRHTMYLNDEGLYIGFNTNEVANTYIGHWLFDPTGNLILPGNTFSVNYANGQQVNISGGGGNTGNVTFDDVTVQGVNQLNLSAGPDFTANLAYLQVRAGDVASHIHFDTGNNEAYDLIVGNDQKFVQVSSTGNIIMSSYDGNTSYTMTLDTTGNLTIPSSLILPGELTVIGTGSNTVPVTNENGNPGVSGGQTVTGTVASNPNINTIQPGWTVTGNNIVTTTIVTSVVETTPGFYTITTDTTETNPFWYNDVYTFGETVYNTWDFGNTGNLTLPTISLGDGISEQAIIRSQRKIIPPLNYSVTIDGSTPTVVYTGSSSLITSLKTTFSLLHVGFGREMFDVSAMAAGANVLYSVSNRLNGTGEPDTSVSVDYNGSGQLEVTFTVNSGAFTTWVTYDSTEFGTQAD